MHQHAKYLDQGSSNSKVTVRRHSAIACFERRNAELRDCYWNRQGARINVSSKSDV